MVWSLIPEKDGVYYKRVRLHNRYQRAVQRGAVVILYQPRHFGKTMSIQQFVRELSDSRGEGEPDVKYLCIPHIPPQLLESGEEYFCRLFCKYTETDPRVPLARRLGHQELLPTAVCDYFSSVTSTVIVHVENLNKALDQLTPIARKRFLQCLLQLGEATQKPGPRNTTVFITLHHPQYVTELHELNTGSQVRKLDPNMLPGKPMFQWDATSLLACAEQYNKELSSDDVFRQFVTAKLPTPMFIQMVSEEWELVKDATETQKEKFLKHYLAMDTIPSVLLNKVQAFGTYYLLFQPQALGLQPR
eukprot:TRINITY_DN62525_c0_g1_i2.p1 TRINITY_DN62525_c0_g1~~TRINITY_DN62525_c0_g1_i2.p1  ORF type:complete len:342 (-),score=-0.33 TRINITY_DN62525_c0_g1_i2:248-1156(-)